MCFSEENTSELKMSKSAIKWMGQLKSLSSPRGHADTEGGLAKSIPTMTLEPHGAERETPQIKFERLRRIGSGVGPAPSQEDIRKALGDLQFFVGNPVEVITIQRKNSEVRIFRGDRHAHLLSPRSHDTSCIDTHTHTRYTHIYTHLHTLTSTSTST